MEELSFSLISKLRRYISHELRLILDFLPKLVKDPIRVSKCNLDSVETIAR